MSNSSAAQRTIHVNLVLQRSDQDNSLQPGVPKTTRTIFHVQCTHCQIKLEKPLKCAKCKGIWYCSKECQKKDWPIHKTLCHQVDRPSGALKLIQKFSANSTLMMYLKVGVAFMCTSLENPRIGFDTPFLAHVDIAVEPCEILDFAALYRGDEENIKKTLQGMIQVNSVTAWDPTLSDELTPKRRRVWREAREKYNAAGFTDDPVGIVEFNNNTKYSAISEMHIPTSVTVICTTKGPGPFLDASNFSSGTEIKQPFHASRCLELINWHIRADKQNRLLLRTEMTEQDKEVIRAAGRGEDTLSAVILREKMKREQIYDLVHLRADLTERDEEVTCPAGRGEEALSADLPEEKMEGEHLCDAKESIAG